MGGLAWRHAKATDLQGIDAVGDAAHPGLPERPEVMGEKLGLWPRGCWVLATDAGEVSGYAISHPWMLFGVPPLDGFLRALPPEADCLYVHDIAIAREARGSGRAAELMAIVGRHARSLAVRHVAGVAVNGSGALWSRMGFESLSTAAVRRSLEPYGPGAEYMLAHVDASGKLGPPGSSTP